jgi:hypothetical protein
MAWAKINQTAALMDIPRLSVTLLLITELSSGVGEW